MQLLISSKNPSLSYHLEKGILYLQNSLTLTDIDYDKDKLLSKLSDFPDNKLQIDLNDLNIIDSAGVAYLQHITQLFDKVNKIVEIINIPEKIGKIIETFSAPVPKSPVKSPPENIFEKL